jgi:hypothetical protein
VELKVLAASRLRRRRGCVTRRKPKITFRRSFVPDGLYLNDGEAIVFEIKISHMPDAWWQLRRLYQPVVERLSYVHSVSVIEVVRSFDPSQAFPEEVKVIRGLDGLVSSSNFRVLLWRP